MVPKRSQEGHEVKAASPRCPGRPQEADSTAIVLQPRANLEAKIEQKLEKNNIKNHWIFDHTFDAKNDRKWCPKSSKIDPKIDQNRIQKGAETKNRKSVKTNNTPSFLVHFCYPWGSKIQQNSLKSGVENEIKIKCDFEVEF